MPVSMCIIFGFIYPRPHVPARSALKSDTPGNWQKSLSALESKVKAKLPDRAPLMLGEDLPEESGVWGGAGGPGRGWFMDDNSTCSVIIHGPLVRTRWFDS